MKLTFEQIRSITFGIARIEEDNGALSFYRFTKEQEEGYRVWDADLYGKSFATSGVRLEFNTNSASLFIKVRVKRTSSRSFLCHDITVNGKLIGQLAANFGENAANVAGSHLFGSFYLGEGEKTVCVYMPWSFSSDICEISLDDGATVVPVTKKRKMIIFGDSITQGYDASSPSKSYAVQMTDFLNANAINKAIGGEKFRPELAAMKDDFDPEIITVAYGTNDWSAHKKDQFEANCKGFYENLSKNYPNAKIFAITPIWRADHETAKDVGPLSRVAEYIEEVASKLDNVAVINGYDFVPQDPALFSDLYLHPNDKGFAYQSKSICAELAKYISI